MRHIVDSSRTASHPLESKLVLMRKSLSKWANNKTSSVFTSNKQFEGLKLTWG
jgi:hypothetical protein